jgi:hypothetical protein
MSAIRSILLVFFGTTLLACPPQRGPDPAGDDDGGPLAGESRVWLRNVEQYPDGSEYGYQSLLWVDMGGYCELAQELIDDAQLAEAEYQSDWDALYEQYADEGDPYEDPEFRTQSCELTRGWYLDLAQLYSGVFAEGRESVQLQVWHPEAGESGEPVEGVYLGGGEDEPVDPPPPTGDGDDGGGGARGAGDGSFSGERILMHGNIYEVYADAIDCAAENPYDVEGDLEEGLWENFSVREGVLEITGSGDESREILLHDDVWEDGDGVEAEGVSVDGSYRFCETVRLVEEEEVPVGEDGGDPSNGEGGGGSPGQ